MRLAVANLTSFRDAITKQGAETVCDLVTYRKVSVVRVSRQATLLMRWARRLSRV